MPRNGRLDPGTSDVLENAEFFPFRVAWLETLLSQRIGLTCRNLVVSHKNRLSSSSVLTVQSCYSMGGGTRATEEVEYHCRGLVPNEESDGVLNRIE